MAFVCKQTAGLVVRINNMSLDNNNDVLTYIFVNYTLPHTSVDLTSCISIVFSLI